MIKIDSILANRYQIQRQLSKKAGRQTFLALDCYTNTPVVIKLLKFGSDCEWEDFKLFEREAATLQQIDCPHIPQYLDYFEVEEKDLRGFALVQSYIDAPSLETLLQQGRKFTEAEIARLAARLLNILIYLHSLHPPIIHRDIKPSNILLADRASDRIGDVYLVDFGSVQTLANKDSETITIVGSYGYIPLEQFGGKTTTASDLYSLGMTLIYLLTGIHPAELPLVDGRVKFSTQISKRFERWLVKMTQPHLDKRFDSARSARVALNSEDGSYGDFLHLKPTDTKIKLYRDREKLEIVWSIAKLKQPGLVDDCFENAGLLLFALLFALILFYFMLLFLKASSILFFPALILVIFPCLRLSASLKKLFDSFVQEDYRLLIDSYFICHSKVRNKAKLINLSKHPRSQSETAIYNPGYTFDICIDTAEKFVEGRLTTISPKLDLVSGSFQYSFPNKFSQLELWWLGKELSDFLNLELQVIYPTQLKIPQEKIVGVGVNQFSVLSDK